MSSISISIWSPQRRVLYISLMTGCVAAVLEDFSVSSMLILVESKSFAPIASWIKSGPPEAEAVKTAASTLNKEAPSSDCGTVIECHESPKVGEASFSERGIYQVRPTLGQRKKGSFPH